MPGPDTRITSGADLALGTVDAGRQLVRRVSLQGAPRFEVDVTVAGANASAITLVHAGASFPGAGTHHLVARGRRIHVGVIVDVPLEETSLAATLAFAWSGGSATVSVSGTVRLFSVAVGVDVGGVYVGENATGSVDVHNHARSALDVDVTAPGAPFSSTMGGTVSIPAGSAIAVPITYAPTTVGASHATLTVAAGAVRKTASVAGTGLDPQDRFDDAIDLGESGGSEASSGPGSAPGDYQRLYLHVPTKNTNVTLGKEYDGSQHDPTHAGYSATTDGHVLIRNRTAGRSMTFQAKDQVWIQSTTGNVYLGAGDGGFNFVAGGGVYFSSGKGIVLAAGHGDVGTMNEFASGKKPPVPAVSAIADAMNQVGLGWTIANTLMAGVGMFYGVSRMGLSIKNIQKNKKWSNKYNAFLFAPFAGFVKTAVTTGMAMHDTINKYEELGRDPALPSESINMFAEGGFLSGTWGFCSIYGLVGATFRSLNAGMLGLVTASLDSLVATGAFGTRGAGLSGLKGVSIDGGLQAQLGTPNGTIDMKGAEIAMSATAGLLVQGTAGVNLAAPTMTVKSGTAFAAQGKQVNASATAKLTIAVGEMYAVEITPAGVKIGSLAGKSINAALPNMEIGPAGVTVNGGPAGPVQLKITPVGVTMSGPGNDLRHMGVTMLSKAMRVELC